MSSKVIFKAKTPEGHAIKILAEVLHSNLSTGYFIVDEKGIHSCMMDNEKITLIELVLNADSFTTYKFESTEKLQLGINMNHFHTMLKTVKKKDSVELFITEDKPTDLGIRIIPKEQNRKTTSYIKIQNMQSMDIDIPVNNTRPINVPSTEFQKMCKSLTLSHTTHVSSRGARIKFSSDAGELMKRVTEFGERDEDEKVDENGDEDSDTKSDDVELDYSETFNQQQLMKISKLSGLSTTIQIFAKKGSPLLFRTNIGTNNLGRISVYLKSQNLQEEESRAGTMEDGSDME